MSAFVITSMFACNLAFHNSIARYLFTLGRDRVLPVGLATVSLRTKAPLVGSFAQTASALLILIPFMIAGADPVTTLFFWGSGIAVVGIVTLYLLTAVAAFVFFRRNPGLDRRPWNTVIAPALAAVAIAAALVLIILNFTTLVGGTVGTAALLALSVPIAFAIGLILYTSARRHLGTEALADLESEVT